MSTQDFEAGYDASYARSWDPASARRQFQMSLILVGALVCSAVVLASTLRFDTPLQEGRSASTMRIDRLDKGATTVAPYAGALVPIR